MSWIFIFFLRFIQQQRSLQIIEHTFYCLLQLIQSCNQQLKAKICAIFLNSHRACLYSYSTKLSSNHHLCKWIIEQHPSITELGGKPFTNCNVFQSVIIFIIKISLLIKIFQYGKKNCIGKINCATIQLFWQSEDTCNTQQTYK